MNVVVCGISRESDKCYDTLLKLACKHDAEVKVQKLVSGKQLLFDFGSQNADVDVFYLEYNLGSLTGYEVAEQLRKKGLKTDIVFYASDARYMSLGYEVGALHYLVKDQTSDEQFERVFLKALHNAEERKEEMLDLFCAREFRRIAIRDILYFEINRRIVNVHYGKGEMFEFCSTLSRLEEVLDGKGFLRIHQAFLVSERYVIQKTKQTITLSDKTVLPIGRSFQRKLSFDKVK